MTVLGQSVVDQDRVQLVRSLLLFDVRLRDNFLEARNLLLEHGYLVLGCTLVSL